MKKPLLLSTVFEVIQLLLTKVVAFAQIHLPLLWLAAFALVHLPLLWLAAFASNSFAVAVVSGFCLFQLLLS